MLPGNCFQIGQIGARYLSDHRVPYDRKKLQQWWEYMSANVCFCGEREPHCCPSSVILGHYDYGLHPSVQEIALQQAAGALDRGFPAVPSAFTLQVKCQGIGTVDRRSATQQVYQDVAVQTDVLVADAAGVQSAVAEVSSSSRQSGMSDAAGMSPDKSIGLSTIVLTKSEVTTVRKDSTSLKRRRRRLKLKSAAKMDVGH